jgi:DNA-directed RNA polymerase specialized sigma24 family protein
MLKRRALSLVHTNEEIFIERYDWLLGWALRFSQGEREPAEDLVHDAFIQFTRNGPNLQCVQNIEAYLYGMLRFLHLSQTRRLKVHALRQLTIVDYDSARIGLRSLDPGDKIHQQEELRRVCQYACERKETSKAGSVLLFRFFHGYYPDEIAHVALVSRAAVEDRLRLARNEARTFIERPGNLEFIGGKPSRIKSSKLVLTAEELLLEMRKEIFSAKQGACLSFEQFRDLYNSQKPGPIDCSTLAHIVSCETCLSAANSLNGLPSISERYPADMLGRDTKSGDESGPRGHGPSGIGGNGPRISESRRRVREVFEHRPKELSVAVNGYVQVSQKIASETSELNVNISLTEQINFVEVISEQGIRLLWLAVENQPPAGGYAQAKYVELSHGRTLEATLNFSSPWPVVRIVYHDALIIDREAEEEVLSPEKLSAKLVQKLGFDEDPDINKGTHSLVRRLLSIVHSDSNGKGFWLRPGLVTALIVLITIAAMLLQPTRRTSLIPGAAEILTQSIRHEEEAAVQPETVLHRTINLEERTATGELIARSRIEVWHSGARGITARRLYSEKGELELGDWRQGNGVQTLYAHGTRPRIQPAPEKRGSLSGALEFSDVWQLEPSAKQFVALIGGVDHAQIEEKADSFALIFVESANGNSHALLNASLVLSRNDLRAIEETLLVRRGNETREFRFIETSFEKRLSSAVGPELFVPELQLVEHGNINTDGTDASPFTAVSEYAPTASADLEVEVISLLNKAGADMGEHVSVVRSSDGRLRVEGVVSTDTRKEEILSALSPVNNNLALTISVKTVSEVLTQQVPGNRDSHAGSQAIESIRSADGPLPVYEELRNYFRGSMKADADIKEFAERTVDRSQEAMRHAWALKRLANQFSANDLRVLNPEARGKLFAIIREHARAFKQETGSLRRSIKLIFFPSEPPADLHVDAKLNGEDELLDAIGEMFEAAAANDRTIRLAFAVSGRSGAGADVNGMEFWRRLIFAERGAAMIQQAH